jgi:hypothetical protein
VWYIVGTNVGKRMDMNVGIVLADRSPRDDGRTGAIDVTWGNVIGQRKKEVSGMSNEQRPP